MFRSSIARSYGSSIFESPPHWFPHWLGLFTFPSLSPHSHQHLLCVFLATVILTRVRWALQGLLICFLLADKDDMHFHVFISHKWSFLYGVWTIQARDNMILLVHLTWWVNGMLVVYWASFPPPETGISTSQWMWLGQEMPTGFSAPAPFHGYVKDCVTPLGSPLAWRSNPLEWFSSFHLLSKCSPIHSSLLCQCCVLQHVLSLV